ncbi:MAG: PDZ domain-containing protein [bacterium]|nr:PDZ domain-containing protein [bacterium]
MVLSFTSQRRYATYGIAILIAIFSVSPASFAQDHNLAKELSKAFRSAVESVNPAVVSIQAESKTEPVQSAEIPEWFKQFLPPGYNNGDQSPQERRIDWQGSGVIISPEGEILTNNHVVSYTNRMGQSTDATKINVTTADGGYYEAEVVAVDPQTDVALIKLKDTKDKKFPFAKFGDSDAMQIGDWVLAIGNPFGLNQSVSEGIISAKGRTGADVPVGANSEFQIKDYIQTTAAINPGNSGGPLINLDGEIIGVNNAIQTAGAIAGNIGIGFAIPSNLAKKVIDDLKQYGKVNRGYLGVKVQEISPEQREYYINEYGINYGAFVKEVLSDSPSKNAGVEEGDLILRVDGVKVHDSGHLINLVTDRRAGDKVELLLLRKGEQLTKTVTLAERPDTIEVASASTLSEKYLGLDLDTLTAEKAKELGYPEDLKGVLVTDVVPGSSASQKNIAQNDVITEMNDKPVANVDDVEAILTKVTDEMKSDNDDERPILMKVHRAGSRLHPIFVAPYIELN